jgi:23S rRNA pseudouridine1911/1915/1917 synthase
MKAGILTQVMKKSNHMNFMQFTVTPSESGTMLQEFLAQHLDISRRKAKSMLDAHTVFVNKTRVWMARHSLKSGDIVECSDSGPAPAPQQPPQIIYQDADYLIVNKMPNILSNGPQSTETLIRSLPGLSSASAAHRLDRDTSGCLLFAKTDSAFKAVIPLYACHKVTKIYHVLVAGLVTPLERVITAPIDGRPAITRIRVLDSNRSASHLHVTIDTGRTHQIRKHMLMITHPVLGDRQYGKARITETSEMSIPRQLLHASVLEFKNPLSGKTVRAKAPLPSDFLSCLRRFHLT